MRKQKKITMKNENKKPLSSIQIPLTSLRQSGWSPVGSLVDGRGSSLWWEGFVEQVCFESGVIKFNIFTCIVSI